MFAVIATVNYNQEFDESSESGASKIRIVNFMTPGSLDTLGSPD